MIGKFAVLGRGLRSGSTWLGELIKEQYPGIEYYGEAFGPELKSNQYTTMDKNVLLDHICDSKSVVVKLFPTKHYLTKLDPRIIIDKLAESNFLFILLRRKSFLQQLISYKLATIENNFSEKQYTSDRIDITINDVKLVALHLFECEQYFAYVKSKTNNFIEINYETLLEDAAKTRLLDNQITSIQESKIIKQTTKIHTNYLNDIDDNLKYIIDVLTGHLSNNTLLSEIDINNIIYNNMPENTFCPLLFQHLATHPYGGVTHCCIADHTDSMSSAQDYSNSKIYNIYTDTIKDTFNSESFRSARLKSLTGQVPRACQRCFDEEKNGIVSKRLTEINNYPKFTLAHARSITNDDGSIDDIKFDFVELRLGNLCNLACRTCNPYSSSKWVSDHAKLKKTLPFKIIDFSQSNTYKWPEQESFWNELIKYCDQVKVFYINGGEPTLIKQHFEFLRKLISLGRTDVTLWYNINMTNLTNEIISLWKHFKHVRISCSIDDLGERNHYIRWPAEWEGTISNFLWLREHPEIYVDITQTVSFMNYPYLDQFYELFTKKYNVHIHHNFVYDPSFLSPLALPESIVTEAHDRFRTTMPEQLYNHLTSFFKNYKFNAEKWSQAIEFTKGLDQIRNQNFLEFFPEFKDEFN